MAEYVLPKRGVAYITYMGLVSQADTKLLIASPTLAAGDFKISKDGGATANLTTLPTNTPAASSQIKISVSATEMEADNVTVVGIDAAGTEWCSFCLNIQTATRGAEDLAFPTVSGRQIDVSVGGEVGLDWANIGSPTTAQNLSATNIDVDQVVASVSGAVGSVTGLTAANLDTTISSRMATYAQPAGFLAATFPTGTIANTTNITAGTITTTTNLTNAPTVGDFTATMKTSIGTAVAASAVASVTDVSNIVSGAITVSGGIASADAKKMNAVTIIGAGIASDLWRA